MVALGGTKTGLPSTRDERSFDSDVFLTPAVHRLRRSVVPRRSSPGLGIRLEGPNFEPPELLEYKDLFNNDTIGKLPVVYHMRLDHSVPPTICAPRRVPLAMRDKIVAELQRMTNMEVITPIQEHTEWVSAMVAAKKKDGTIRLCIDPVNLNKALLWPHHPLKTVEEVIADMPDAKMFSILDAKCGFWQVPLSEESSRLTTFMTPVGCYTFLRMPYGITTGSEVFQRCMEQIDDNLVVHQDLKVEVRAPYQAAPGPMDVFSNPIDAF
ncbi:hypothetical protein D4764_17G0002570 [Takifugu flavidus]|uniref:ribonuclease H n=1 Tax=Takifugu flavidus TaxID=433684 RepID=A0A5C6NTG4_9TELE|nr:hypothetical protein D4764_17G0002570 [Takifugu flavidus]